MALLIRNGRILDPASGTDAVMDLLTENDVISRIAPSISAEECGGEKPEVIDAAGCFVMPGLIDMHVHLRDPGLTYKEDITTGGAAAAKGGFTTIMAMPNTMPVADCAEVVEYVNQKAAETTGIHIYQIGAVTKGQLGKELSDIEDMAQAGIIAISEDGKSVMNAQLYKEAMEIAAELDLPVLAHCEDINLVNRGVMNADEQAERLGLRGISNSVEDVIVARDILLAKETGARLHLCHCSTRDSVEMVRQAKEEGLKVSAEVCPHHFTLTSEDIPVDDGNYKMNPPVRRREDKEALIEGLRSGVIDVIATDHAPHSEEEKNRSMEKAAFGIVGLETAVALTITQLVETGVLSPLRMAEVMSYKPACLTGLPCGRLQTGAPADIVIIDPKAEYVIDKTTFVSKGKNTPFDGWTVRGRVLDTICAGKVVYRA